MSRPRNDVPKGCVYKRGKRYWYKLEGRFYPCTPAGGKMATTRLAVAKQIARQIHARLAGLGDGGMDAIVEEFARSDALTCYPQQAKYKRMVACEFVKMQGIESPADITPAVINDYMGKLILGEPPRRAAQSPKTVVNKRAVLGRFCRHLVLAGELGSNPVKLTDPPKVIRGEPIHLSRVELGQALRVARRRGMWSVFFAAYTGARLGEIKRLTWGDLRQGRDGPIAVFRKSKTNKPRSVPITPKLMRVIQRMEHGDHTVLIFPARSRKWWTAYLKPVKGVLAKMARAGGGWTDFRRTVGSLLVQDGNDILVVSKILGHATISTTARHYAHLDAEAGRKALASI